VFKTALFFFTGLGKQMQHNDFTKGVFFSPQFLEEIF